MRPFAHEDRDDEELDNRPSRSQLKRDVEALQALGEELITLSVDALKKFDLPETLKIALLDAKKITANGAIRRQRQYIGKLMRNVDPAPIQAQLSVIRGDSDLQIAWLHRIERWRDRLVAEDDALADLMDEYTVPDVQALRQAIRNARKELAESKPPKFYRVIFKTLKQMIPAPGQLATDVNEDDESEDESQDD